MSLFPETSTHHSNQERTRRRSESGFSLVELMIALVLGLIVIGGVINVFLANKQSYRTNEALSQVQDASRTAFELIARDVRQAGFGGVCRFSEIGPINVIADPPPDDGAYGILDAQNIGAVFGASAGHADQPEPLDDLVKAGTDFITLRSFPTGENDSPTLVGNMAADNANVQLSDNAPGFVAGETLMITDCRDADVFRASNVSKGSSKITIAHAKNVNKSNKLSKAYQDDAFVFSLDDYRSATYFIGRQTINGEEVDSLYLTVNGEAARELVRGVTDMQITYRDVSNTPDYFDVAGGIDAANWPQVNAVRVALTMQSGQENVTTDGGRLARTFETTIAIRNRL